MSDTVCIYIKTDDKNALFGLISACISVQKVLLEMEEPILCRGAITKGDFYHQGNRMFGPGFVEAYNLEEHVAVMPRIIIDKTLYEKEIVKCDSRCLDVLKNQLYEEDEMIVFDNVNCYLKTSGMNEDKKLNLITLNLL